MPLNIDSFRRAPDRHNAGHSTRGNGCPSGRDLIGYLLTSLAITHQGGHGRHEQGQYHLQPHSHEKINAVPRLDLEPQ